jgi:hypothetical protein
MHESVLYLNSEFGPYLVVAILLTVSPLRIAAQNPFYALDEVFAYNQVSEGHIKVNIFSIFSAPVINPIHVKFS